MTTLLPYAIGYAFAVAAGGVLVGLLSREALYKIGMPREAAQDPSGVNADSDAMANPWTAAYVGLIERILYVASLQSGAPEFIGIWLALKVAGGWKRWSERRKIFQVFLIGSGFSVLYSVVGFRMIQWDISGERTLFLAVPVILVVLNLSLWGWLRLQRTG